MGVVIAQWRPEYETGDMLVDEQHQSLFSTINALNNAMLEGQGEALLEKTLQSLKDYTAVHFDTEERFMLQHHYPGYATHRDKHEAFKQQFLAVEQENHQDPSQLTIKVSHFLTNWLIYHIKDEDLKMITFCCQRMKAEPPTAPISLTPIPPAQLTVAQWRTEYETGFTLIDDQHKSLFHAINALNNAILTGRAEELLEQTLKSLRNYTTLHFETEERFMLQYGYSDYQEHKEKHDQLRIQVEDFNEQETTENLSRLTVTVSHFLTHWLIHHIKNEDQKMITFLRQQRQKEQANRSTVRS